MSDVEKTPEATESAQAAESAHDAQDPQDPQHAQDPQDAQPVAEPEPVDTAPVSDPAQAARTARFGKLPERIEPADMVQEVPAETPDPSRDTYNPDEWLVRNAL